MNLKFNLSLQLDVYVVCITSASAKFILIKFIWKKKRRKKMCMWKREMKRTQEHTQFANNYKSCSEKLYIRWHRYNTMCIMQCIHTPQHIYKHMVFMYKQTYEMTSEKCSTNNYLSLNTIYQTNAKYGRFAKNWNQLTNHFLLRIHITVFFYGCFAQLCKFIP